MKIDIYCNDGSPLHIIPQDIYGRGVGGAELALFSWSEEMAKRGHQVRIFNDPREVGFHNDVEFRPCAQFSPEEKRDVFVAFRSPNRYTRIVNKNDDSTVRLFWSCDQQTTGDFRSQMFPFVDRVVCISPYHVDYFKRNYQISENKVGYFDLGVRLDDYNHSSIEKKKGQCIFCSIPERGLDVLKVMWPSIVRVVPRAELIITSDYRLWGAPSEGNHKHKLAWLHKENVKFLGAIPRKELVQYQLSSDLHVYPSTYEEMFCISSAECQVAGAYSITSNTGALRDTNEFGLVLEGGPMVSGWVDKFAEQVINHLSNPKELEKKQKESARLARLRFDWSIICEKWEHLIETGEFI